MSEYNRSTQFDEDPVHELSLGEVLANRASKFGDGVFLIDGESGTKYSYADVNANANRIANALLDVDGVETGSRIGTLLRDKPRTVSTMFGCAKAGLTYAPINTEYKNELLIYQLNDTQLDALIIGEKFLETFSAIESHLKSVPKLFVSRSGSESGGDSSSSHASYQDLLAGSAEAPGIDVHWHDTAWVMYTSGTTGLPKGVVIPHRYTLLNHSGVKAMQFTREDVVHNWMPLYHIGGASGQITSALQAGASVALWDKFSRSQFWDRIEKHGATSVTLLTVMLRWLMAEPGSPADSETTINKLQLAELPPNHAEVAERYGIDIVNVSYSQTEIGAATWGVIHYPDANPPMDERDSPGKAPSRLIEEMEECGIPVTEDPPDGNWMGQPRESLFKVTTLNEHDETVPLGETGELAIRPEVPGIILREYLGKPQKLAEDTSNLWMHTDDLGIKHQDQHFVFVDRIGNIIRRRGENISPAQLESVVQSHDTVATAAVFPVQSETETEDDIVVVVETTDGETLVKDDIREFLKEDVAEFMMPQYVFIRESLPTTQTNKIQKEKLKEDLFN